MPKSPKLDANLSCEWWDTQLIRQNNLDQVWDPPFGCTTLNGIQANQRLFRENQVRQMLKTKTKTKNLHLGISF